MAQRSPPYLTFTWWCMWKVECSVGYTRVLYRPHHHLKNMQTVECSDDCTKVTCWPCHHLMMWKTECSGLLTMPSTEEVCGFQHFLQLKVTWTKEIQLLTYILLTTKVSMWIPALSPLQSHLNKRNTTLDIYYWQQNLWTRSLILISSIWKGRWLEATNECCYTCELPTHYLFFKQTF